MPGDRFRRALLLRILRTLPYESRMIPGVAYDAANPEFNGYTAKGIADYLKTSQSRDRGVEGTWIAHSRALEEVEDREGFTVVLEDDFVCRRDFFAEALRRVNAFDRDFDVILFDPHGNGPLAAHQVAPTIYQSQGESFPHYWGSHCVLVNNRNIPKILAIKRQFEIKDMDGFFLRNDTGLNNYLFYTGKCRQVSFGTHTGRYKPHFLLLLAGLLMWTVWTRCTYLFSKPAAASGRDPAIAG